MQASAARRHAVLSKAHAAGTQPHVLAPAPRHAMPPVPGGDRHEAQLRQEVEGCLGEVTLSAATQQEALQRGLALTDTVLGPGGTAVPAEGPADYPGSGGAAATPDAERRRWWLAARLRLLQHLERLDTAVALHNG